MMSKPTVFFSHSSKDKEQILAIRDKLDKATGGVLDIFLSSDGQSIPFGTNWVHKVEQGLKNAKIMFVFATENSIRSGWIYFEAGFAYSKGIKVIPIGLGVSINDLKAPLSLLQGFDIESADSLNNIIAIINKEFDYHFSDAFASLDYQEIMDKAASVPRYGRPFDEIVLSADYTIKSESKNTDGSTSTCDIRSFFDDTISYLEKNGIQYSHEDEYYYQGEMVECILVSGVKILYKHDSTETLYGGITEKHPGFIRFVLSAINFENSFNTLNCVLQQMKENKKHYVVLRFRPNVQFISRDEDLSSIISMYPEEFVTRKESIGRFVMKSMGVRFQVFDYKGIHSSLQDDEIVIGVPFDCGEIDANSIICLVMRLVSIGIIKLD